MSSLPQQALDFLENLPERRRKSTRKMIKLMSGFTDIINSTSRKFELLVAKHSSGSPTSDVEEMNDLDDFNTNRSYEQLQAAIKELAHGFADLANLISEKAISPMEGNRDKLIVVHKAVTYDIGKCAKEVTETNSKAQKAKLRYHKAKEELFELECEFEASISSGINGSLQSRILTKQNDFFESRDDYIKNIKISRHIKLLNQKKVDNLIGSLEKVEHDRIDSIKNGVLEFITAQSQVWKILNQQSFNLYEQS
jgi:hypothetical protein